MSDSTSVAVILPAGGRGSRFAADGNKIFQLIGGQPVWFHAVNRLQAHPGVVQTVIVLSEDDQAKFWEQSERWPSRSPVTVATGGDERFDSVAAGLHVLDHDGIDLVAIHDAARPILPRVDLDAVIAEAAVCGAAMLATPVTGSIKRQSPCGEDCIHVDRANLWIALTPQVFKREWICDAYARQNGFPVTDDAQLVEKLGHPVKLVPGSPANLKLTYPDDLPLAEALLKHHG